MKIKITKEQYTDMRNNDGGYCIACKEEAYGIEPDAREYICESCDASSVYGIEELLIMGKLEIK